MLNMNLNTILRCNINGLRPINAISLARVIAVSLDRVSQVLIVVKHRQAWVTLLVYSVIGFPVSIFAGTQTINHTPVRTIRYDYKDTSVLSEIRRKQFEECLRTCQKLSKFDGIPDSIKSRHCFGCENVKSSSRLAADTANIDYFADSASITIFATNNIPQDSIDKYVSILDTISRHAPEVIAMQLQPSLLSKTIFIVGLLTIVAGSIAIIAYSPYSN